MKSRGLTLLELILALSILALVSLGASVLFLSATRTGSQVHKNLRSQALVDQVFQDMEMNLRGLEAVEDPATIELCSSEESLSRPADLETNMASPAICATSVDAWTGGSFEIWLRGLRPRIQTDGTEVYEKVGYGYRFYQEGEHLKTEVVRCVVELEEDENGRLIDQPCEAGNTAVLVYGVWLYADGDVNSDGMLDPGEASDRDRYCLDLANWKNFGTFPFAIDECKASMPPVFKISPSKKFFTVSLSAGEMENRGVGMTRVFYLHETGD